MNSRWRSALFCFCLTWSGALIGCSHGPPQLAPAEPPAVPVSHPVDRVVTDYVDFTGRTDAVQSVDIRARVTGYLVEMPFKEGAEVKKGDLLVRGRSPALPGPARSGRGPGQPLPGPTRRWPRQPTPATRASPPGRPVPSASRNSTSTRRRWTRPMPLSRPPRRAWRSTSST